MTNVDMTFRNLDAEIVREVKAEAVRRDKRLGEVVNEAFRLWLEHKEFTHKKKKMKLSQTKPVFFRTGIKDLSERVDEILYGR